ncbi:MAG: hypothetical protein A3K46_08595 [Chloroflexi bacterium RBG_13_60_9]|nr:MAG: hypothetical protein A3K46_08595 [Chloroflexi bacterium RBG_13_60_9]
MQDVLDPFRQIAALQKDPMPASPALDAYVRAQPDDFPLPASAGVRFPQLDNVAQGKIGQHAVIIITPGGV